MREHLTEPWGIVAALVLGGLGGAVALAFSPDPFLAVVVTAGIALLVYGVRVGAAFLTRERASAGSTNVWISRAEAAVATLRRLTADPAVAGMVGHIGAEAADVLGELRHFAGQLARVDEAAARVDVRRLRHDQDQLHHQLRGLPAGPLRQERERALTAVTDQLAVALRLAEARETLLARMQSTAYGLEGLVARLGELTVLSGPAPVSDSRVAELADDLDALRAGLAEAEAISRRALKSP